MTFSINYFAIDGKHITLKEDGSIILYIPDGPTCIQIDYEQAKMLKKMILAEYELGKK